ncbi:hypothetical protein ATCC90586_007170 [Pythium insidiosum]|nr:hypothetical protein ATCC90586_007170 [Pythium insidiosum]
MKFLCVVGVLVSALALATPAHAAECTLDELYQTTSTVKELGQNRECAKITERNPTTAEMCKYPVCVAYIKTKLHKFPDCSLLGENVRSNMTALTNCDDSSTGSSSSPTSSASRSAVAVAGAVLMTAVAAGFA